MILGFLWMLIVGLIVGALARLIMPGKDQMGLLMTAVLGIAGSVIGGLVGGAILGRSDDGRIFQPRFLFSLAGAILLLWLWRRFRPSAQA